ncbi:MAG TPA: cation:proton antiporter [Thermohalobaculum sp.]|nr:cation:proton antiporter [Thermohalobaculum sp.]
MDIVVFSLSAMALALALIALAVPLAKRIGLPLSVIISGAGLAAGTAAVLTNFTLAGTTLATYDLWFVSQVDVDSSALLYIFLPPLLFEMALAVNVRRMLDDIGGIVVLAVIAVVAATALVGLAVWAVTPFAFTACLLLGAAVATTDPAAVITTFREIGAPKRLLVLLEGESLLNDAAAIAIFTFLLALAAPDAAPTATGVIFGFLYSFGVGAGFGLLISVAASRIYPLLGRSSLAEASMTVAVAYGAYLLADQWLGASGVVAVVFAGLATGSAGFVHMGPGNWNTVHAVWTQIGFWANTLILMIVALITPWMLSSLSWKQAALVAIVYAGAYAARALILFGVLPMIARFGQGAPMDRPQRILVFWGGVRGAVTLILAISLTETPALGDAGPVLGALAAAFTLTTLFVNASTLALLASRLGLDQLSPADLALRGRIIAGSIERVRSVITDIASARTLEPGALAAVEKALGQRRREAEVDAEGENIPFGERLRLGLAILSGQEARLIRRSFEEGAIGPRATNRLRLSADRIADAARAGGRDGYEKAVSVAFSSVTSHRIALIMQHFLRWDRPIRNMIELQLTVLMETDRVIRGLQRYDSTTVAPMIGEDAAKNLGELLARRLEHVRMEIAAIERQYPAYVAALEQSLITRTAIRRERQQYVRLHNDGVIGSELRDDLIRGLDRREREASRPPRLDLALSPETLIDSVPLFKDLNPEQRRKITRHLRTRFTAPGETIITAGDRGSEMFFIASGVVEVRTGDQPAQLSSGDFFGEPALFIHFWRRSASVVSMGFSRLLTLSRNDFLRLAKKEPAIEDLIRSAAESQLANRFPVIPEISGKKRPRYL